MFDDMTAASALLDAVGVCLIGAAASLVLSRWRKLAGWTAFLVIAASSALAGYSVLHTMVNGPGEAVTFLRMPELGFALRIYVDGLSAVFVALIATVALPAAFFSIRYMDHYPEYGVGRYYPAFLTFLAAMYGLVSTTDMMYFFFIFWQMMTFAGFGLIRFERKKPENLRAATKYLFMMQVACALTMIGAWMLASEGVSEPGKEALMKFDFDAVTHGLPSLLQHRPGWTGCAFLLFLLGFGIKLGMWPFGRVWLPDAHPAAPSPVSAMLSGVMIKTGIYGVMRYFLWLVPAEGQQFFPLSSWGFVIAMFGTITLFTGTIQALRQDETKRLLAFSSIGQVGYILLGIGICLALLPLESAAANGLAALALIGALFHTINHGVFKSLLFLNAGSMIYVTGTQDMNRLGGLMKWMPLTALTSLVAVFSISGVPLFSGFVSKWSIYTAGLSGTMRAVPYLAVCTLVAILTSAITLALFIKFFGVTFLSRSSALVTEAARKRSLESPASLLIPQAFLALICVSFGLLPAIGFKFLQTALAHSPQGYGSILAQMEPLTAGWTTVQQTGAAGGIMTPLLWAGIVAMFFILAVLLAKAGGAARRAVPPWLCGYAREHEQHRYVARHFYGDVNKHFSWAERNGGAKRRDTEADQSTCSPAKH